MPERGVAVGSAFCPQDVAALQYCAPRLAVDCLSQALPGPLHAALILDVACGTGLVAAEVRPPQTPLPSRQPLLAQNSYYPSPRSPLACSDSLFPDTGTTFTVGPPVLPEVRGPTWEVAGGNCEWVPPPQLQARGFRQLHGVDGSPGMLDQARARGLYQCLSLCTLGQEPLPSAEGTSPPTLTAQGPPSDRAPSFCQDAIPLA